MVFPDLHKVFCTTRGTLKIKIFKTDCEVVSWEAPEMPLTKQIVWIRKGRVSNALDDPTLPWDCSSTRGYKTHTHTQTIFNNGLCLWLNQCNLKLLGAKLILTEVVKFKNVCLNFPDYLKSTLDGKKDTPSLLGVRNGRWLWKVKFCNVTSILLGQHVRAIMCM